ncbi:MAG: hypothetical protein ABIF82_11245 [Planctomycetota bacterium]
MKRSSVEISMQFTRLEVEDGDWDDVSPAALLWMLQQMILIRRFEEALLGLHAEGKVEAEPLITSRMPLERWLDAFELLERMETIRTVLEVEAA